VFVIWMAQALLRALDIKIYTSATEQTLSSPSRHADTYVQDRICDRPKDPFASQVLQNSHKAQHHAPLLLSTLSLILISTHTHTHTTLYSPLLSSPLFSPLQHMHIRATQSHTLFFFLGQTFFFPTDLILLLLLSSSNHTDTHTHKTNTKQFQN